MASLQAGAETGLDAFALNLGSEEWQCAQAREAFRVLAQRDTDSDSTINKFKLFLSLDMHVLPSNTEQDMMKLVELVTELGASSASLKMPDDECPGHSSECSSSHSHSRFVLGTFGGGDCSFGGRGWPGFLEECSKRGVPIYFVPSFFLPPETITSMPYVDASFFWNGSWRINNQALPTAEEQAFVRSPKPYMAAVSPWFSTHYGTTGPWAWNK